MSAAEHLDAIGLPILEQGGEILKFMGDGLLAVFPIAEAASWPCVVCGQALDAAEGALVANQALNERRQVLGLQSLEVDLALHYGDVVYGNIGSGHRLDFTVIGRAVNEVSRMETLCDELDRYLVLSEVFAARCAVATEAIGRFALRDIAGERTIYARAS
jgi:adenylate cyclase